jgi:hypothetical protein
MLRDKFEDEKGKIFYSLKRKIRKRSKLNEFFKLGLLMVIHA